MQRSLAWLGHEVLLSERGGGSGSAWRGPFAVVCVCLRSSNRPSRRMQRGREGGLGGGSGVERGGGSTISQKRGLLVWAEEDDERKRESVGDACPGSQRWTMQAGLHKVITVVA